MSDLDLNAVSLAASRLQNGYAHAIDTRDWAYFETLFTPDVEVEYAGMGSFTGMAEWLGRFVPFHDECEWTLHVMTNHLVGEDQDGVWATCYGDVRWTHRDQPGAINHAVTVYRDRLRRQDETWRIARRQLDILLSEPAVPIPEGLVLPTSVRDLAEDT